MNGERNTASLPSLGATFYYAPLCDKSVMHSLYSQCKQLSDEQIKKAIFFFIFFSILRSYTPKYKAKSKITEKAV